MSSEQMTEKPLVLVVEDMMREAREVLKALQDEGYSVDTAATAEEAIQAIKSAKYEAILLDIELPLGESESPVLSNNIPPERAGLEMIRYVRTGLKLDKLPIVVVSGLDHCSLWPAMREELESEEMHVADIITKPTGLRDIICSLSKITGRRGPLFKAFKRDDPDYCEGG